MRVIDVSRSLGLDSVPLPGYAPAEWRLHHTHEADGRANGTIRFCLHEGTHVDPPYHFHEGGATIDEIPIETLVAPGMVIRLGSVTPGRPITLAHLMAAADLPDDLSRQIVIIDSGWDDVANASSYYGPDAPYLAQDVADWLVSKRARAVGLTNPPDQRPKPGERWAAPIHRTLLGGGVLIIENITNLDAIEAERFTVVATPLKIHRGCGGPARVIVIEGRELPA